MACSSFPVGRFRLVLIEPLLSNLYYMELDKSVVRVGLRDGDFVIPFDRMGLPRLLDAFPESVRNDALAILRYNALDGTWTAEGSPECSMIVVPAGEPDLNCGGIFEVNTREGPGAFRFKLVKLLPAPNMGVVDRANGKDVGLEPTRLSMLPHVPLRIIAGFLSPLECVNNLIPADPLVLPKVMGGISRRELAINFKAVSTLSVLRCLRLISKDHVTVLIASRHRLARRLEPAEADCVAQEVAEILTGTALREAEISFLPLRLLGKQNAALKKIYVVDYIPDMEYVSLIWSTLAALPVGPSTEILLSMSSHEPCRHHRIDDSQFQAPTSPLVHVTDLRWISCRYCPVTPVPPLQLLPNLRRMVLICPDVASLLVSRLSRGCLLHLTHVFLKYPGKSGLEALFRAAPHIKKLALNQVPIHALLFQESRLPSLVKDTLRSLEQVSVTLENHRSLSLGEAANFFVRLKNVPTVMLDSVVSPGPAHLKGIHELAGKTIGWWKSGPLAYGVVVVRSQGSAPNLPVVNIPSPARPW